jgi:hypothetical protein
MNLLLVLSNEKNILFMKFLLLILSFSYFINSFGQNLEIDSSTGLYYKSDIIIFDSLTKEEIFNKSLKWVSVNYKNPEKVIKFKDLETGEIIIEGNFSTNLFMKEGWIRHKLILQFKDGKLKYSFSNLVYYSTGSGEMPLEGTMFSKKKVIQETELNINNSIESLKSQILEKKSSDW